MWSDMNTTKDSPILLVISAPSGGGKTTLCQELLHANQRLQRGITCTTRNPRPGEQNGVDYYFLTVEDFKARVAAGDFLEHAEVYGNYYGTLKAEVLNRLRQGFDVMLSVDVQGVASIKKQAQTVPELANALVTVFLTPPSLEILEARLRKRAADSDEVIRKRLGMAREEISHWREFDYLIISGPIAEDFRQAQALIEVEKMRISRLQELPVQL
jgi:guanylate kinase